MTLKTEQNKLLVRKLDKIITASQVTASKEPKKDIWKHYSQRSSKRIVTKKFKAKGPYELQRTQKHIFASKMYSANGSIVCDKLAQ